MIHYEVRIKSDWKIDMSTAYVSKLDTTDEHNNNNNKSYIDIQYNIRCHTHTRELVGHKFISSVIKICNGFLHHEP